MSSRCEFDDLSEGVDSDAEHDSSEQDCEVAQRVPAPLMSKDIASLQTSCLQLLEPHATATAHQYRNAQHRKRARAATTSETTACDAASKTRTCDAGTANPNDGIPGAACVVSGSIRSCRAGF